MPRPVSEISRRPESARAGFAGSGSRGGRPLRGRSHLEQAARTRPENDEHRGEAELLRCGGERARSQTGGEDAGDFAGRGIAHKPRDLPGGQGGATKRAPGSGLGFRESAHEAIAGQGRRAGGEQLCAGLVHLLLRCGSHRRTGALRESRFAGDRGERCRESGR